MPVPPLACKIRIVDPLSSPAKCLAWVSPHTGQASTLGMGWHRHSSPPPFRTQGHGHSSIALLASGSCSAAFPAFRTWAGHDQRKSTLSLKYFLLGQTPEPKQPSSAPTKAETNTVSGWSRGCRCLLAGIKVGGGARLKGGGWKNPALFAVCKCRGPAKWQRGFREKML